jgi:hypothetical protein
MLPAHSLVKVTFISTRPGILRSRRILNHAKPSITAGGMKNKIGTHRNDTYLFTGYIFISDKDKSHVRNDIIRKKILTFSQYTGMLSPTKMMYICIKCCQTYIYKKFFKLKKQTFIKCCWESHINVCNKHFFFSVLNSFIFTWLIIVYVYIPGVELVYET